MHIFLKRPGISIRILIAATLIAPDSLHAQNGSIFNISSVTLQSLDSNQFAKYQKFSASDFYNNHTLIKVDSLLARQKNGRVAVTLPGYQCNNMVFSARNVEYTDESNYYWYGEIFTDSDEPCHEGTLTLMSQSGEKFGHLVVDSTVYEYNELGNGVQVLSEVNDLKFTESECAVDSTTLDYSSNSAAPSGVLPCVGQCDIRIFVHYTQAALNAEANINNRIALAIAQTNQGLLNSNVQPQNARVVLAGSALLSGFAETPNNIGIDVNTYAARADVQSTRNNTQADLMILLTNGSYGQVLGRVLAIGPNFATSFGISQTGAATTGRYTFAHEVAHLLGARHNDHSGNPVFAMGYIFKTGWFIFTKKRYTIMALLSSNKSRIQHFSNPDVFYLNKATGVANQRDNAMQLRNTGCFVGNFFPNPLPPLSGSISGPIEVCACENIQFEANVSCGSQPYSFQWSYSYDGILYDDAPAGNSMFYTHVMPCSPANFDYVFIRVRITDNQSNTVTIIKSVRIIYPSAGRFPSPCELSRSIPTNSMEAGQLFKPILINLIPNPATSTVQIEVLTTQTGDAIAEIININGQAIRRISMAKVEKGVARFTLNISGLLPGSYYIKVRIGKNSNSRILIVKG